MSAEEFTLRSGRKVFLSNGGPAGVPHVVSITGGSALSRGERKEICEVLTRKVYVWIGPPEAAEHWGLVRVDLAGRLSETRPFSMLREAVDAASRETPRGLVWTVEGTETDVRQERDLTHVGWVQNRRYEGGWRMLYRVQPLGTMVSGLVVGPRTPDDDREGDAIVRPGVTYVLRAFPPGTRLVDDRDELALDSVADAKDRARRERELRKIRGVGDCGLAVDSRAAEACQGRDRAEMDRTGTEKLAAGDAVRGADGRA